MKKIILLIPLFLISQALFSFNIIQYYNNNRGQNNQRFLKNFPYKQYLSQVKFTNFRKLQQDRTFLNKKQKDLGDQFLFYLGERFIDNYPVQNHQISLKVSIAEQFVGNKQGIGINNTQNDAYTIIGYFLFNKIARFIENEMETGQFDIESSEGIAIRQRLEKNRIYIRLDESNINKLIKHGKKIIYGDKQSYKYLKDRATQTVREWIPSWFDNDENNSTNRYEKKLSLIDHSKFYPLSGGGHALHNFSVKKNGQIIGRATFMKRPHIKANYVAHGNVFQQFVQFKNSRKIVLATTGGFTNSLGQPEGLTIQKGKIVNALMMPERSAIVVVESRGGLRVINLEHPFMLPGTSTKINPKNSLIDFSTFLSWAKNSQATLFQSQLLAFSDKLLIDITKAPNQIRERRLLVVTESTKDKSIDNIIFDIPVAHNLAEIAKDIFDTFKARENVKIISIINLDVGSYNILEVYAPNSKLISGLKGPIPISNATNLIIYTLK